MNEHRTLRICLAAAAVLLLLTTVSSADTYVVKRGDTLYGIAQKFSTTVSVLQQANDLHSSTIRVGRVLVIPGTEIRFSQGGTAQVVSDGVQLRSNGKTVAEVGKGTKVTMIALVGDFVQVRLADGRLGWVKNNAIGCTDTNDDSQIDRSSVSRDVVRTAYAYRGSRYRRGGMSSRGFDCSGFVKYVYASKGIKLPHSSAAMFNCGKPVAKSDLEAGDLVFFAGTYRRGISHVGLYIGEGKMIHASTSGGGVRVEAIDSPYFRNKYAGARRL